MTPAEVVELLRKHRELEALIAAHNWWLGVFTITVALGILAETLVEFFFSKNKSRAEIVLTIICSAVVLGGVVGEYIQGSNVADSASELQQMADKDVGSLYKQAGDANERAAEANQRAADAQRETATIEKEMRARTLALDQQKLIRSTMEAFAGERALISLNAGDPESFIFSLEIKAALGPAWMVLGPNTVLMLGGGMSFGVWIAATADDKSQRAAHALVAELVRDKFDARVNPTVDKQPGMGLSIFVGPRPPLLLSP